MTAFPNRLVYGSAGIDLGVPRRIHRNNLDTTWGEGIRSFDTAPIYAHGQAEQILGEFLSRHPDASVTTKVGLNGNSIPRMPAFVFRSARWGSKFFKKRQTISLREPSPKEPPPRQNPETLDLKTLENSLYESLDRLGRSSISTLLMHEVHPSAANNPATVAFVQNVQNSGVIEKAGLGGSGLEQAADCLNPIYQVMQTGIWLGASDSAPIPPSFSGETIAYGTLRPLNSLSLWLQDERIRTKWMRELDSPLDADEGLPVWLVSWVLNHLRNSKVLFYSSRPAHIRQLARGTTALLADPDRISLFERLYLRLASTHDS